MRVVFTGRCDEVLLSTRGGHTRAELCRIAGGADIQVDPTVGSSTDFLVASRIDTQKARRARDLGVHVITYEEFLIMVRERRRTMSGAGRIASLPARDGGRMNVQGTVTGRTPSGDQPRQLDAIENPCVEVVADAGPRNKTLVKKPTRRIAVGGKFDRALDL